MPARLLATNLATSDIGELAWDTTHNPEMLAFDGPTVSWRRPEQPAEGYPPAWVPASTRARLHSGTFRWDFVISDMQQAQIGVGFMLVFEEGVDWGFFGYLGAGHFAWSYDPSTGDVVNATESIAGGLPTFADGENGTVTVEAELPRTGPGVARFIVNGRRSPDIALPESAVIMPAACLLHEAQRVRLGPLTRTE